MIIKLAAHYGLCFGVRDAIKQAESLAAKGPLTILGELVHNPVVRERLAAQGVREGSLEGGHAQPPPGQVMITAHGASDTARQAWRSRGFGVADGTCPLVRHAHGELRALVAQGCFPVVIGKRGHVEVLGLTGDFPGACVLESAADIAELPVREHYGVVAQTTQPVEKVRAIVEALRQARAGSEVRFRDTVCQPTKDRQNALRELLGECDTLVVVGGRNSNNTLQLVAAGRAAGLDTYHVERAADLCPDWFAHARVVGVTAGTSTLKETVAAVEQRLQAIAAAPKATMSTARGEGEAGALGAHPELVQP